MASMSKRAQARTEKELHDLLNAPGNASCADCGARNPSWASWNLGVFLCMRCASIHRKLGTHISKVKSLSMDTWSNDQVESMKRNGNIAVNKTYNPKNKRPDMPLDADEVDSAMERFIRKKYQEKSLSDGRPEVPSRDEIYPPRSRSPDASPPPALPSKKGRFFGFGLRSSSSAYPLSKHDKKHRNQQRGDTTFRLASADHATRSSSSRSEMSDHDLQVKLGQLQDMGFTDNERNTQVLKRHGGDIERSIAALVKLGPSEPTARRTTPTPTVSTGISYTQPAPKPSTTSAPPSATISLNPFDQPNRNAGSVNDNVRSAPQSATINANPWQAAMTQSPTSLERSFSNMQVSQPLFPHSTGGCPVQPQYGSQPIAPTQILSQQHPLTSSPINAQSPWMQAPVSAHSTGSNPYASYMQSTPSFAPSNNPFLNMAGSPSSQHTNISSQGFNPFGLPPPNSTQQTYTQTGIQQSQSNVFDSQPGALQQVSQPAVYGAMPPSAQPQYSQPNGIQSPLSLPNFQYGQPQSQQLQQQQLPVANGQSQHNPYFQQQNQQQQPQLSPQTPQSPYNPFAQQAQVQQMQQAQQQPNQPLMPQMTGQLNKQSILALYNYPQMAPSKPLASIPEPSDNQDQAQVQQSQQQMVSPAPSEFVYGGSNNINSAKRSATLPASTMHSAGGAGSRNPFMTSANSSGSSTPAMPHQQFPYGQGARHASHDSVVVNNQSLQDGRHSPDAFASLSARYVR